MNAALTRRKPAFLAVTALTAVLALSACQESSAQSAPKGDGPSSSAAAPSSSSQDAGNGAGKDTTPTTLVGSAAAKDGDPCTGANVTATVKKVSRPINHLVLQITNKGSKRCDAFGAPLLRFDDAQAATRVLEDSQPQSVVGVQPGKSAYAAIGLLGEDDGQKPTKVSRLQVHFQDRKLQGSVGTPVNLTLPTGTAINNGAYVTYWQSNLQDALTY